MTADISSGALKRLFELSDIPLALSAPQFDDCPLVLVNEPFLKLTGYTRDEVIGRNCRFLQGPNTREAARRRLGDIVRHYREGLVQITNYRKDGTEFENLVFLRPIFSSLSTTPLYYLGSQFGETLTKLTPARDPLDHAEALDQRIELISDELQQTDQLAFAGEESCVASVWRELVGAGGSGSQNRNG